MTTSHPRYIIEPADLTVFALDSMTARKLCASAGCEVPARGNFSILAVGGVTRNSGFTHGGSPSSLRHPGTWLLASGPRCSGCRPTGATL